MQSQFQGAQEVTQPTTHDKTCRSVCSPAACLLRPFPHSNHGTSCCNTGSSLTPITAMCPSWHSPGSRKGQKCLSQSKLKQSGEIKTFPTWSVWITLSCWNMIAFQWNPYLGQKPGAMQEAETESSLHSALFQIKDDSLLSHKPERGAYWMFDYLTGQHLALRVSNRPAMGRAVFKSPLLDQSLQAQPTSQGCFEVKKRLRV